MKKVSLLLLAIILTQTLSAQSVTYINPANMDDPRIIFANPAIYDSSIAPGVLAGYQNLFSALSNKLNNSFIGFYLPTASWGRFALTAPRFQSPHFSQSALEFRYSYTIDRLRTAFGVNAGTMLTSYNSENYQLVDLNDPLLLGNQSLNVFNIGLGVAARPLDFLTIGLTADHLNRPRMSFQGGLNREIHWQAGVMAEIKSLKPMAMWELEDGEPYWSIGAEYWFPNLPLIDAALARAFIGSENLILGGGLRYKNVRLDYLFDYPTSDLSVITGPSHQFVVSYRFEKEPCDTPPVAYVDAETDTLRWLPNDVELSQKFPDSLVWQSQNQFLKNGAAYEILNPQANPFANYVFFKYNSAALTDSAKTALKKIISFYNLDQQDKNFKIKLVAHISGGKNCDGADSCETVHQLAINRIAAVKNELSKLLTTTKFKFVLIDTCRFSTCIQHTKQLKEERQRVDIQVYNERDSFVPVDFGSHNMSYTNQSINFDLSQSDALCGWKNWLLGVWTLGKDGKRDIVWSPGGRGQPADQICWNISSDFFNPSAIDTSCLYRFRIEDRRGCVAVSDVKKLRILPFPKRLLLLYNFDSPEETLGGDAPNPSRKSGEGAGNRLSSRGYFANDQNGLIVRKKLDALAKQVKAGRIVIERIIGYTDTVGLAEHNLDLSCERAFAVKNYIEKSSETKLPDAKCVGEDDPLILIDTPAGRWLNRRVEIIMHYK